MTETNFGDFAARMETDLNHFRSKSDADDDMIALLQRQLEMASMESTQMAATHAEQMRVLRQERDEAVRERKAIRNILDITVKGILTGIRKIEGDATPMQQAKPAAPIAIAPPVAVEQEPEPGAPAAPPIVRYDHLLRNDLPAEVRAFAPPRLRPSATDEVDAGLADIVNRVAAQR